jgi:hypothetical protein
VSLRAVQRREREEGRPAGAADPPTQVLVDDRHLDRHADLGLTDRRIRDVLDIGEPGSGLMRERGVLGIGQIDR